jgi:Monooxygenase af470-like
VVSSLVAIVLADAGDRQRFIYHQIVAIVERTIKMPRNKVISGRMTANLDGEFVILLIGMRINKPWKVHKWWPVFVAMPRLLRRLSHDDLGMLSYHVALRPTGPILVQYWRSIEQLQRFAREGHLEHLAAWRMFNHRVGFTGDVGFWHETYMVRPGDTRPCTETCRGSAWRWPASTSR